MSFGVISMLTASLSLRMQLSVFMTHCTLLTANRTISINTSSTEYLAGSELDSERSDVRDRTDSKRIKFTTYCERERVGTRNVTSVHSRVAPRVYMPVVPAGWRSSRLRKKSKYLNSWHWFLRLAFCNVSQLTTRVIDTFDAPQSRGRRTAGSGSTAPQAHCVVLCHTNQYDKIFFATKQKLTDGCDVCRLTAGQKAVQNVDHHLE